MVDQWVQTMWRGTDVGQVSGERTGWAAGWQNGQQTDRKEKKRGFVGTGKWLSVWARHSMVTPKVGIWGGQTVALGGI